MIIYKKSIDPNMLALIVNIATRCRHKIIFSIIKNESVYLKNKINNKKQIKIEYERTIIFLLSLELGGFLKRTKNIIVLQKINKMNHPDRKAI